MCACMPAFVSVAGSGGSKCRTLFRSLLLTLPPFIPGCSCCAQVSAGGSGYPLEGGGPDDYLPVSTTRPETILGDTAVAVHPEDPRYAKFVGKRVVVPCSGGRTAPVIADEYVDREFGTGALKITPGHDPNDYEIGKRHDLETINIMNKDATLNANAGVGSGARALTFRRLVRQVRRHGPFCCSQSPVVGHGSRRPCDQEGQLHHAVRFGGTSSSWRAVVGVAVSWHQRPVVWANQRLGPTCYTHRAALPAERRGGGADCQRAVVCAHEAVGDAGAGGGRRRAHHHPARPLCARLQQLAGEHQGES
eukprot:364965-Chlamydomonas_euryale.AAC.25